MYTVIQPERRRSEHYVNNKEFLAAIVEYKRKVIENCVEKEHPGITHDELKSWKSPKKKHLRSQIIGECFLKIATHLITNQTL